MPLFDSPFSEYDDGDGNESHEQYGDYNYSSASQQSTSPNKRKHEKDSSSHDPDDEINDQSVEPNDGESSTSSDNLPKKKRRKEFANPNAKFMDGIQGVRLVTDQVINVQVYQNGRKKLFFLGLFWMYLFYCVCNALFFFHYSRVWVNYKRRYRKCANLKAVDFLDHNRFQWM